MFCAGRELYQGADWPWFNLGTQLLFKGEDPRIDGPGGLHVFATEPRLHMGPLSLVGAAVFRTLYPGDGRIGAALFMCALGPVVILIAERAALRARGLRNALDEPMIALVTLVSGGAFLFAWTEVTWAYGRLDEFMVICGGALALWFAVNRHPLLAGATVGLSIGAKSWGVFLLPILAALPWRQALRACLLAVALGAVAWLPFVLADAAGTIDSLRATEAVRVVPGSGAHALGVDLGLVPDWLRPVQAALALALAALAVVRGRWAAALLLAVGARLALDPGVIAYYTAALVFAAFVWDLFGGRRPLPIWALGTLVAFFSVPELIADSDARGLARVGIVVAAIVVVLAAPKAWLHRARPAAAA